MSPEDLLESAKRALDDFVEHTVRTQGPERVCSMILHAACVQCEHVEQLSLRSSARKCGPDLLLEAIVYAWGRKRTREVLRQLIKLLDAHVDALEGRRPRSSRLPPGGSL